MKITNQAYPASVIEAVEHHFHNRERWWGALAAPDETNAIEANVTRPFAATSGNDTWGAAIPICGTADEPTADALDVYFDAHRILITDLDAQVDAWRLRFIWGTGNSAAAIAAGQWSEIMVEALTAVAPQANGVPVDIRMPRVAAGTKLWAQAWNDTNGEILSFFYGVHGYSE